MIKEFKDFIAKGNLIELAVAFVMGVAFAALMGSFIDRIVNPLIGMIFGLPNLENVGTFGDPDPVTGVYAGSIGALLASILNFLLLALVMFMVVKAYNRMQPPPTEVAAEPSEEVLLLREIRDGVRRG